MIQRVSIGANGEFFIESNEALTPEGVKLVEDLYEKVLEIRERTRIVSEAMDDPED